MLMSRSNKIFIKDNLFPPRQTLSLFDWPLPPWEMFCLATPPDIVDISPEHNVFIITIDEANDAFEQDSDH